MSLQANEEFNYKMTVEKYSNMVYRLAYFYTNSKYDADDIYQEVFLKYLQNKKQFENEENVIIPNKDIDFGVTDMRITGIAYLDNKLHIQVSAKNKSKLDNHGYVYLKNIETNEKKMSDYNLHFCLRKKGNEYDFSSQDYTNNENRRDFTEYVFDISKEELNNYNIYGDFVTGGLNTEGDWKITFPL